MAMRRSLSQRKNSFTKPAENEYDETERYLRDAQDQLSRSFHELVSIGATVPGTRVPQPLQRRKSAVELTGINGKYTFAVSENNLAKDRADDRPVLRRKRFTRRARKSVTIEPETGLILAIGGGDSTSSEEERDSERGRRSRSEQRVRVLSSSATALSHTVDIDAEVANPQKQRIFQSRGPAARRANRRFAQKVLQKTGSTGHLEKLENSAPIDQNQFRYQKKSMSVRDLQGQELDFRNQDHVTRWASQILAELDSLPSSRVDLTLCGVDDADADSERRVETQMNGNANRLSILSSPLQALENSLNDLRSPPPEYRHSMFLSMSDTQRGHPMSSSLCALNNNSALHSSSIELRPLFSNNRQNLVLREDPRERGDTLTYEPPCVPSDSESTPRASPSPSDHSMEGRIDEVVEQKIVPTECALNISLKKTPHEVNTVVMQKGRVRETMSEQRKQRIERDRREQAVAREQQVNRIQAEKVAEQSITRELVNGRHAEKVKDEEERPPVPMRRHVANREQSMKVKQEPPPPQPSTTLAPLQVSDRFRRLSPTRRNGPTETYPHQQRSTVGDQKENTGVTKVSPRNSKSFLEDSDSRLMSSIARLTKSVYGEIVDNDKSPSRSLDRRSIPSINMLDWSAQQGEDPLSKWRKEVLDSHGHTDNKLFLIERMIHEACAECRSRNPLLSTEKERSVNRVVASLIRAAEESSRQAADRPSHLDIPDTPTSPGNGSDAFTQTSPFSVSRSSSFDWINEPTEGLLKGFKTPVTTPRSEGWSSHHRTDSSEDTDCDAEVQEMTGRTSGTHHPLDESIALLLQYSQEPPKPKPRTKLPNNNLPSPSGMISSPNPHRRLLEVKGNSESLPTDFRRSMPSAGAQPAPACSAPAVMSDSLYDNVPRKARKSHEPSSSLSPSPPRQLPNETVNHVLAPFPLATPLRKGDRSGSCEVLSPQDNKNSTELFQEKMRKAEEDADECCDWLVNAGFPQYAQQYKEGGFPVDLKSVHSDHSFLDGDSLNALFRRLQTLNRTAIMRIDNVIMRRQNPFDNCEDDEIALSGRWQYQRSSHTWNRVGNEPIYGAHMNHVSTRPDRNIGRPAGLPRSGEQSTAESTSSRESGRGTGHRSLQRSQSERIKERARAFMKKMDIRSSSRRRKTRDDARSLVIGDPVLVSYDSASPESMRMMQQQRTPLNAYDASLPRSRSKSSRRQGFVLVTPTTPGDSPGIFSDDSYPSRSPRTSRRDRSVPPPRTNANIPSRGAPEMAEIRYLPPYSAFETYQKNSRGNPYDAYLYPQQPQQPMNGAHSYRSRASSAVRTPLVRSVFATDRPSLPLSPTHSDSLDSSSSILSTSLSPYSQRFLSPSAPQRSARPNVLPDGYFMHEMSPEGSVRRGLPRTNPRMPIQGDSTGVVSVHSLGRDTRDTRVMRDSRDHRDSREIRDIRDTIDHRIVRDPRDREQLENKEPRDLSTQLRVGTSGETKQSQSSLDGCTDSEDHTSTTLTHTRRDSGVGSSLSRSPSGPSAQRVRASVMPHGPLLLTSSVHSLTNGSNGGNTGSWPGKRPIVCPSMSSSLTSTVSSKESNEDAFFTDVQLQRCVDSLGLVEMARVKKLAYLRVTAMLEKYGGSAIRIGNGPANGGGGAAMKNWAMQKLIKKIKQIDSGRVKEDFSVFGHSLETIYKKTSLCLPRSILEVLRFLRLMAPDTVGIFRKNGVRSRIQELREIADTQSDIDVFVGEHRLLGGQVHDAADMLKQYLRELPDPLMTSKLSETFANIYLHLPENERLPAVQYAILLLPDENREALQTLLFFLHDVAKNADQNNMTAQNLSVCFTPSLFQLSASRLNTISPTRRHKTIGAAGMPTEKEMKETRAVQACLTQMIHECRKLFLVPDSLPCDRADSEEDFPLLNQLGGVGYRSYMVRRLKDMLKEHSDRWKGWAVECHVEGVEVSSKKTADVHPLRAFKATVDVEAPPREVMQRILRERPIWDPLTINWRLVDTLQSDTDIYQYVINDTIGHPTRDCYVVRMHRGELSEIRGACAIVERSIHCAETQLLGGVSAAVLDTRVLIEPCAGKSRLTYISRIDMRGRSLPWYSHVYTSILGRQMARVRDSFHKIATDDGPETKV